MKRAFLSAFYAWLTGVAVIFTYFYFIEQESRTKAYAFGDYASGLGWISAIVACAVFPIGMAIVAPLMRKLLRAVPKLNAWGACLAGIGLSLVCLYGLAAVYRTHEPKYGPPLFVPHLMNEETLVMIAIATTIGGTFSYQYAKRYRRDRAPVVESPAKPE